MSKRRAFIYAEDQTTDAMVRDILAGDVVIEQLPDEVLDDLLSVLIARQRTDLCDPADCAELIAQLVLSAIRDAAAYHRAAARGRCQHYHVRIDFEAVALFAAEVLSDHPDEIAQRLEAIVEQDVAA